MHFLIPVTLTVEQLTSLAAMSNMWMILHVLRILGPSLSHHVICTVVKLIATLLARLTCHPMRAHHGVSRAEFSLTEPIPLQAENRERKTVLEAKYLEQADQWVPASQFAIQYI